MAQASINLKDTNFTRHGNHRLVAIHPILNIIAISNQADQVDVFRFSGSNSRAFGVKSSRAITALCWKDDGKALRISWDGARSETFDVLSEGLVSARHASSVDGHIPGPILTCWSTREGQADEMTWQNAWMELPPLKSGTSTSNHLDVVVEARNLDSNWMVDISINSLPLNKHSPLPQEIGKEQIEAMAFNSRAAAIAVLFKTRDGNASSLKLIPLHHLFDQAHGLQMMLRSMTHLEALTTEIHDCASQMNDAWKMARTTLDLQIENVLSDDDSHESDGQKLSVEQRLAVDQPIELKTDMEEDFIFRDFGLQMEPLQTGIDLTTALKQLALTGMCSTWLKEWITDRMGTMVR